MLVGVRVMIPGRLPVRGRNDSPSSVTFVGTDILVTNLTYFTGNSAHDLVLRLPAGERGVAALRPTVRS